MTRSSSFDLNLSTVWISSREHLADRDAGPARNHLGDGLRVHRDRQKGRFPLDGAEGVHLGLEVDLQVD